MGILLCVDPSLIWPDPVPCRPENPVQGIRNCVARLTNSPCPWLNVDYCGVRVDEMSDAFDELGLDDLNWILEDDLDPDDVAEAAVAVRTALGERAAGHSGAAIPVRWLANLLDAVRDHGAGLSNRFAERIDSCDRY